jgi:AhpD family alkylhydroperoxidase
VSVSSSPVFPSHTVASAPPAARRTMAAMQDHWGYLPSGAARLATSPRTLDGFLKLNGMFEASSLDPVSREVLVMTVATRNGCHICVAIHTQRLSAMDADPELISALRAGLPLTDPRLEALRIFVRRVLDTTGDVGEEALQAFLAHGYTAEQALEVVLGIGTYTLSTFANRLTAAPLDAALAEYAWEAATTA